MDQITPAPAPQHWVDALDRSAAEIAAGRTVPIEPVLDRLRASIARMRAAEAEPKHASKA